MIMVTIIIIIIIIATLVAQLTKKHSLGQL